MRRGTSLRKGAELLLCQEKDRGSFMAGGGGNFTCAVSPPEVFSYLSQR